MTLTLLICAGGRVSLPDQPNLLLDRADGGNLCILPPRAVWERGELSARELTAFGFLVAAAGYAMMNALPQLRGGCINYWEAGNWALNGAADPVGPKTPREHRRMHLHLLGRSPTGKRWGESPAFPDFADRLTWAAGFARFTPAECAAIVAGTRQRLQGHYGQPAEVVGTSAPCPSCGYPAPVVDRVEVRCAECEP